MLLLILGLFLFLKAILFLFTNNDTNGKILIDNLDASKEDIEDDIDAVITWVDSSDKFWQEQQKFFYSKETGISDNSNIRFPNTDFSDNELYYCVSTINKYLPWIRNIFIITCFNQKPSWIDKFPKVKIIDHTNIIPNEYLPTFNSHLIESYIHKIKNLSEKFIYFNDDFYVNRYIKKNFFFYKNYPIMTGRIRKVPLYYTNGLINKIYLFLMKKIKKSSGYIICSINSKYLLLLNKQYITNLSHVAIPLTRKIMYDLENNYENDFIVTGNSKFRSHTDLRITYVAANYTKFVSLYGKDKNVMRSFNYKEMNCIKDQFLICINNCESIQDNLALRQFFQEKHNIIY